MGLFGDKSRIFFPFFFSIKGILLVLKKSIYLFLHKKGTFVHVLYIVNNVRNTHNIHFYGEKENCI